MTLNLYGVSININFILIDKFALILDLINLIIILSFYFRLILLTNKILNSTLSYC